MKLKENIKKILTTEALRIGSVVLVQDDPSALAKLNSALNILSIASDVVESDTSRANKMVSLARSIAKSV